MIVLTRLTTLPSRTAFIRTRTYVSENVPPKKPMNAFSGGLVGFIVGAAVSSGIGYYYLVDEYHTASSLLLSSVEELQISTNRVRDYARKIEMVEKEVRRVGDEKADKLEISALRQEMKKLYDLLNIEHIELKTHVWGIEQDLHRLAQNSSK